MVSVFVGLPRRWGSLHLPHRGIGWLRDEVDPRGWGEASEPEASKPLFDETASEAGAIAVAIYLDIVSFYDNILHARMIRELVKYASARLR